MHAHGVIHRDVKLENIFLDSKGRPKLGDFDMAVFMHEPPARAPVGTIFYMSPEVGLFQGPGLREVSGERSLQGWG
jgi:serine/threonine protein kinase